MTYLRFAPRDYWAVCRLLYGFDLARPVADLKRFLVAGLLARRPALAGRVCRLRATELRLLRDHFAQRRRPRPCHGLSPGEVRAFAEAFGPLLAGARSLRPVKEAASALLLEASPEQGRKLDRMSLGDFEALCERVKQRRRRGP